MSLLFGLAAEEGKSNKNASKNIFKILHVTH